MRYVAVLVAMAAVLWTHHRAGATLMRHRRIVAWYWAPAAALITASWVQARQEFPLAVILAVSGGVLISMWVSELIHPTIQYREDPAPCETSPLSPGSSTVDPSSAATSSPSTSSSRGPVLPRQR